MSTVFHSEDYDYLKSINTLIIKISSFDLVNYKLIDHVSSSDQAIILSTGMANLNEIDKAYEILKKSKNSVYCIVFHHTH